MTPLSNGDPDSSITFDEHADSYDADLQRGLSLSGETKEYFSAGRLRHLHQRLSAMSFTPKSVLDYGCGDGSTTPLLFDILGATSVVGADTSAALLAKAKSAYQSDATRFHFLADLVPAADFDIAFCNGVFHHIPPRTVQARRGMCCAVYVPAACSPSGRTTRGTPVPGWS